MKRPKLLLLFIAVAFGCSSCATLLNRPHQVVSVRSTESVKLIYEGDTLRSLPKTELEFVVKKEKHPFNVVLFNDSSSRTFDIQARKSWTYALNLFTPYLGGLVVDEISGKKFTYPKRVYVDMDNTEISYLPYYPMPKERLNFKNRLSITPTAIIGIYHPGIEIGYQRLFGELFALQTNLRYLLAANTNYSRNASGFRIELNPKYYLRNQEKSRIYTSLSLQYLRKDHEAEYDFLIPANFDDDDFQNDQITQLLPVEKRFFSLTPRIGVEHYLSDRLVIDAFFGVGLRYRETRVIGANPNFLFSDGNWEWFDVAHDSNRASTRLSANLDFNFRIGWVF
ncbi:hypothetical protein [Roseivirga sp. E12]|uniref:hypothetical protein n=1 Tax=Roseivirga sp. E12 TaxID=2819237 RepID=UPI001ABC6438|nr:hypothetical protein [Roseivirga sp. E12]MBO3696916.1 hypothetical protein [Roseivirga sp. E12]